MGRTDGESIEHVWLIMNGCASSTKEMGLGSRHDTLNCHFNYLNWTKYIMFGQALGRKLHKVLAESAWQTGIHTQFTACLPMPELLQEWMEEVTVWEADMSLLSPYMSVDETLAQAKHHLEEKERVSPAPIVNDTSAAACLFGRQTKACSRQRICVKADGEGVLTPAQATELQKKCKRLQKNLWLFQKLQMVYMPSVALKLSQESVAREEAIDVEDETIWMPSDFPAATQSSACWEGLAGKEEVLWEAECLDALEMIRSSQRTLRAFYVFCNMNVRGQVALTRAATTVERQVARSRFAENKYRRNANVVSMAGADFDVDTLLPLGEGHHVISWIWLTEGSMGDGNDEDLIKVEWLKSRARAQRWSEEVELLREEMQRVLVSLKHRGTWWETRRARTDDPGVSLAEGIGAYADHQALVQRKLVSSFKALWEADSETVPEDPDWEDVDDEEELPVDTKFIDSV
ncbi:hypothetical protein EDD85DRAFT_776868 [Armillaria nabsnona]|nr:hypothetical protein EDD85DRAFT_776868 [Armillaria nabsnona]